MSSQTHRIELQAKDGTKQAFDSIKRSALEDVKALQQMGKEGSRSLKEIEKAAREAQTGMDRFKSAQRDLTVGVGALAGAFALASRASLDQSRQIDAINRLYGESADEILKLSEAIQDNTNFSNDSARQAAITGATLASNYALTADQIGVLIQRSADLAQIHGIDLADAMTRVSGAIRGEGEAAELLGLNMSDSAVAAAAAAAGLEGWTTTMTEAEKAAFRYTLVLDQTTSTLGASQAAADTSAGKVRHLANEVQDAAQQFAAWTGPVGESVAVLSDYALQTGLALAGVTQLAKGLNTLGAASKVASLAMGPAGLVLAAGAAAAALYVLMTQTSDLEKAQQASASATTDFANQLATLSATGSKAAQDFAQVKDLFGEMLALQEEIRRVNQQGGGSTGGSVDELSAGEINDIKDAIIELFSNPFVDSGKVTARIRELFAQFRAGTIDSDELRDSIVGAAEAWSQFADEGNKAATTTEKVSDSTAKFKDAIKGVTDSLRTPLLNSSAEGGMGELARNLDAIGEAAGTAGERARASAVSLGDQVEAGTLAIDQYRDAIDRVAEPFRALADMQELFASNFTLSLDDLQERLDRFPALLDGTAIAFDDLAEAADAASFDVSDFGEGSLNTAELLVGLSKASSDAAVAIEQSESALDRLARGSTSAGVALRAFKDIQDEIISQQDVFNQQYSEYGSQISAIERAVTVLQERQAEGIALTQEETEFLNEHTAALERLEGGQDDAAVSAGILAAQYGENMTAGDALNQTLAGVTGATESLSDSIDRLVIAMVLLDGTDANPSVSLAGAAEANAELGSVLARMAALDGSVANATVNVGANIDPALKGVGGFAQGGMVSAAQGRMVRVNEGGREMATLPTGDDVWLPTGTMVWPHAASKMGNRGGGGGAPVFTNCSFVVQANNPQDFYRQLQTARIGSARR